MKYHVAIPKCEWGRRRRKKGTLYEVDKDGIYKYF